MPTKQEKLKMAKAIITARISIFLQKDIYDPVSYGLFEILHLPEMLKKWQHRNAMDS